MCSSNRGSSLYLIKQLLILLFLRAVLHVLQDQSFVEGVQGDVPEVSTLNHTENRVSVITAVWGEKLVET